MGEMYGADADQLDRLSRQFNTAAEQLVSNARQITSTLNNSPWVGGDATQFRENWNSVSAAQIGSVSQLLRTAATNLTRQATEQRVASGDDGGGLGGGGSWCGIPGGGKGPWVVVPDGDRGRSGPWGDFPWGGSAGGGSAGGGGGGGGGGPWGGGSGGDWGGWGDILSPGVSGSTTVHGGDGRQFGIDIIDYSVYEYGFLGDVGSVKLGNASGGVGFKMEDGHQYIGAFGEVSVARVDIAGNVIGNDEWGVDAGVGASVLEADGFIGYKDGKFGAEIGGNLASVDGQVGVNLAGHDVAVTGEIGFKLELGLSIGKETEIKFGPVSVGFNIGW